MNGLALSSDARFGLDIQAAAQEATGNRMAIHHCVDFEDFAEMLAICPCAVAFIDNREEHRSAVDDLAAVQALDANLPIVLCLDPLRLPLLQSRLMDAGAFDVLPARPIPAEAIAMAVRHAVWIAGMNSRKSAYSAATGVCEAATPYVAADNDRPLLAEVSHEMRSPLGTIIGFAESIEREALGPWQAGGDHYRAYAKHIRDSGEHLLALFDDLLEMGDINTFGLAMDDNVDPLQVVSEVEVMLQMAAARRSIVLERLPGLVAQPIRASRRLLIQALLNLGQNAIKFTAAGGSVSLSLHQSEETVFTVEDCGIGFDPKQIRAPRSSRGRPSLTTRGHGLGLRFVERIARGHGGRLIIESEPGHGTQMRLIVPNGRLLS
jgi:signal transduction histidine kinase